MLSRLQEPPIMKIVSLDVVGQKAIFEATGSAMQKNGRPYNNRCVINLFGREKADIEQGSAGL
jgi:hypothetical protein